MAKTFGELYNQAVAADPTAGLTIIYDESGNPILPSDAYPGQPTPEILAQKFDPQKWFDQQGIIPLDPKFDPNIKEGIQDIVAQKYGFPNYMSLVQYKTGPGQIVNDPVLGNIWVPNERNYQNWNIGFVGALNQKGTGSALSNFINNFVGSGGLVNLLGGQVLSAASPLISDYLTAQGVSPSTAQIAAKAAIPAASSTVSGLAQGQTLGQSLKSGAISGGVSGLSSLAGEYAEKDLGLGDVGGSLAKTGTSYLLSNLLSGGSTKPSDYSSAQLPTKPPAKPTTTGQSTVLTAPASLVTPGSAALAQALRTDMGEPIFGGEKKGAARKWGEGESTGSTALREMGSGIV